MDTLKICLAATTTHLLLSPHRPSIAAWNMFLMGLANLFFGVGRPRGKQGRRGKHRVPKSLKAKPKPADRGSHFDETSLEGMLQRSRISPDHQSSSSGLHEIPNPKPIETGYVDISPPAMPNLGNRQRHRQSHAGTQCDPIPVQDDSHETLEATVSSNHHEEAKMESVGSALKRVLMVSEESAQTIAKALERQRTALDQGVKSVKLVTDRLQQNLMSTEENLLSTEAHISSLQSSRVHLTASEAASDFKSLLQAVDQWIIDFITPVFMNNGRCQDAIDVAESTRDFQWIITEKLREHGARLTAHLPDTEEDIVKASMFQWLTHRVFHNDLFPNIVEFFEVLERSMTQQGELLYAVQSWRAETYNAWIKSPNYRKDRHKATVKLTNDMLDGMAMFFDDQSRNSAGSSLFENVMKPAVVLKERMESSRERFQVLFATHSPLSEDQNTANRLMNFEWEIYSDVTDSHRALKPTVVDNPNEQRSSNGLVSLMIMTPGLIMRKVQRDNKWGKPEVIAKQNRLVAWKKDPFEESAHEEEEDPTFFSLLCRRLRI
ncbi:hypothetical protein PG991_009658 [Apiospora marii]|uniref:Uncharacterized protein n=1 Tax=Apiospora marii TaxID=335849 RepID=A0ABR1RGM5_9PEZI